MAWSNILPRPPAVHVRAVDAQAAVVTAQIRALPPQLFTSHTLSVQFIGHF